MSRKHRPNDDSIVDSLLVLPWWFSVVLAAVALPAMYFGGGLMMAAGDPLAVVGRVFRFLALPAAAGLLLLAGGAALQAQRRRNSAGRALTSEGRAELSSKEFEFAVAELLKSRGYHTEENLSCGPDGGVDVRAWRDSNTYLVQCKLRKDRPVGRPDVQRLLGAVTGERAAGGILVTSGSFTREAREFASNQPIELIDGEQLTNFVAPLVSKPKSARISTPPPPPKADDTSLCPKCHGPMETRTVTSGPDVGKPYLRCRRSPRCDGRRPPP